MVAAAIGKEDTLHLRDRIAAAAAQQFAGFLL
jgi:hypothetical protein